MKKASKIISLLLVLVMIVALVPTAAFASSFSATDIISLLSAMGFSLSDLGSFDLSKLDLSKIDLSSLDISNMDPAQLMQLITDLQLPTLAVLCMLNCNLPAANATVTLTNQFTGETVVRQANALGIALLPKNLLGVYTISATCAGPVTGTTYCSLPGVKWSFGSKLDVDDIILYPALDIGLNYSDHFSYMVGYNDGTVRPYGQITRAEAASMIYRIMTPEAREEYSTKVCAFTDVASNNPHRNAIAALANADIINGYNAVTFGPNDYITRGQFAAILGRMFSVSYTGTSMFGDLKGDYSDQYINLLAKLGIMKGDNGNANAGNLVTRAQAAAMLNRLLGRLPASDSMQACTGTIKQWPDNPKDAWFYADILEATNSHNYTFSTDASNALNSDTVICETWTSIRTDTPNWVALQK